METGAGNAVMAEDEEEKMRSEIIFFTEKDQAFQLIGFLTNEASSTSQRASTLADFRLVMDRYLEAPTLLDPYIESMVSLLGSYISDDKKATTSTRRYALSAVYSVSKVRGRKHIAKFLPHGVNQIEPVFAQLLQYHDIWQSEKQKQNNAIHEGDASVPPVWESVFSLWIWMGALSLTPFDCATVASGENDSPWFPQMVSLAKIHLKEASSVRDVAAASLAFWLARPDLQPTMTDFVNYSKSTISDYHQQQTKGTFESFDPQSVFGVLGVVQILATLLKTCPRTSSLLETMRPVSEIFITMTASSSINQVLLRKWITKWLARMGCIYMPPRVCLWRYNRGGRRSLMENLRKGAEEDQKNDERGRKDEDDDGENELFPVPDEIEDIMGHLLVSLRDSSTMVRWSAAKGIGSLTERLPRLCSHDVLDALLAQLERDSDRDTSWQGACLALGELARRGLLLPSRLNEVVPVIMRAIQFDVRKGSMTVGAHVRDAACYVYWAFARAYSPSVMKPHVLDMSRSLVVACLFDREVNCRRAASAAFQENVGRQGATNFPHGITILTTADYYSLGNINNAYTEIAWDVAKIEEYKRPIITHLYTVKLFHWDIAIRMLTSKSLHGLAPLDVTFVKTSVVPPLIEKCTNSDLIVRHGALLGMAEILLALQPDWDDKTRTVIAELVPKIEKMRLYRGRGGEIMRSAVCRYIECISRANITLTVKEQVRLLDTVDGNLKHPKEEIQASASAALGALMTFYFPVGEKGPSARLQKRVVDKYVQGVSKSNHPAESRGFAMALGCLPKKLVAPTGRVLNSILVCLCRKSRPDSKVGRERDAETRRNCIASLASVCRTVGFDSTTNPPTVGLTAQQIRQVFDALLLGLGDYNTERRGDVGSWSRMTAMTGLVELSSLVVESGSDDMFDQELCQRVVGGLLKQLSEKLDNVRLRAGECLDKMLRSGTPRIIHLPSRALLEEALETNSSEQINWSNASVTFRMVMKAAEIDEYFFQVMSGMVVSVGALTESVTKQSEEALVGWLRDAKNSGQQSHARIERFGQAVLRLFQEHKRQRRVILPLLKTLENIFRRGFMDYLLKNPDFPETLLGHLKAESKSCSDMHTLLAVVGVSLGLLSPICTMDVNQQVLSFILDMLGHQYPRVRRHVADNLYARLLEDSTVIPSGEKNESSILDLILETQWDSEHLTTDEIVSCRNKLTNLVGITPTPNSQAPALAQKPITET